MSETSTPETYGLASVEQAQEVPAPVLPYLPRNPKSYRPKLALVGCGGIAAQHLHAYKNAGFEVAALCSRDESRARAYQQTYFPSAQVTTDFASLLRRDDLEVFDLTAHPAERVALIEAALRAGKHVLSQKPFVLDLDVGERLCDLAEQCGVTLAVNQNGRWAPHFSYLKQALDAGLIGSLQSVNFSLHWDHRWIVGTRFEEIEPLILYDFGIHWFDLTASFFAGRAAQTVYALQVRALEQGARVPLLAHALIEFDGGTASLNFNANVTHGQTDRTVLAGTSGTLVSEGPSLSAQSVTLHTATGRARPALTGTWFVAGFHGAMAELLCAVEERRPPQNSARGNLRSLALCFAAVASAQTGRPCKPGEVRSVRLR